MKKTISATVVFLLVLIPAVSDAAYLIRLKNGGELVTPRYWAEGNQMFFFYEGGTAGIERTIIDRIEKYEKEPGYYRDATSENIAKKELPPLSSVTEKSLKPEPPPEVKAGEEKVNIQAYKDKKDKLTVELDGLLEKLREATRLKDDEAKAKLKEEMRNTSAQIYKLTDEVTEKNKGKLPEGWWEK